MIHTNIEQQIISVIQVWAAVEHLTKIEIVSTLRRLADWIERDDRARPWESHLLNDLRKPPSQIQS